MTQVLIDRELLERAVKADASRGASSIALVDGWKAMEQIRAILAHPTQQGEAVEVVEVVGYRFFHVNHGYIFRRTHIYEGNPSLEAHSLMTVAQHERILAAATRPADQVAESVVVSRELLENCADYMMGSASARVRIWHDQCRALLAAPAQGVAGLVDILRVAVEYLDSNTLNSIAAGSTCHRKMSNALAAHDKQSGGEA